MKADENEHNDAIIAYTIEDDERTANDLVDHTVEVQSIIAIVSSNNIANKLNMK
jgi:hypothetical protein